MSRNFMVPGADEIFARIYVEQLPEGARGLSPIKALLETIDGLRAKLHDTSLLVGFVRRAITESDDPLVDAVDVLLDSIPSEEWEDIVDRVRESIVSDHQLPMPIELTEAAARLAGLVTRGLDLVGAEETAEEAAEHEHEHDEVAERVKHDFCSKFGIDPSRVQVFKLDDGTEIRAA